LTSDIDIGPDFRLFSASKLKFELQLVARLNAKAAESEYYPPRARWYSPFFCLGDAVRRRLALDRIHLPREMTWGGVVAGFLVPGLAVHIRGPRLWGKAALLGCGFLFLSFMVWFGRPAGNFAFGLLLSIHTTGFMYYCSPLLQQEQLRSRLFFTLLTLVALGLGIYLPARNVILQHWLMPLRINGQVAVVQRQFSADAIRCGDWIAYRLRGSGGWEEGAVRVRSGMGLGPVLAMAGDRVEFSPKAFTVNGISHPSLPHMPTSGGLTVPENNWFVWPNVGISGHGNVGEDRISAAMLQMATVSREQFAGKPFKRWFWRRQILS
jgi:hypothetical protein